MPWLRSDDGLPEHPKADALKKLCGRDWQMLAAAWMVWHHMGCDCAKRLTDGHFDRDRAHHAVRLPVKVIDRALELLVEVRFMDTDGDNFVFLSLIHI